MTVVQTLTSMSEAHRTTGAILGGGTLLMRQVSYAPHEVPVLLRVTDPALKTIGQDGDRLRIGAQVTMAAVMAHGDLRALWPVARAIGGPALRNMATVGGNLFAPHPYGDFTTALLALGARVHWADGRVEDLEDFLGSRSAATGLVAAVSIPRIRENEFRFIKASRTQPKGVSFLFIAAQLATIGGRVERASLAFGAMGPTPLRAKRVEAALAGQLLDEAGIATAVVLAGQEFNPPDDALASAWYRNRVAPVYLKRLLLERS
mgnify:CR=1 FL=1